MTLWQTDENQSNVTNDENSDQLTHNLALVDYSGNLIIPISEKFHSSETNLLIDINSLIFYTLNKHQILRYLCEYMCLCLCLCVCDHNTSQYIAAF